MSQVSKVEEAILLALSRAEVKLGGGLIGYNFKLPDDALAEAKQALLSIILEALPEKVPIDKTDPLERATNIGYNIGIDQARVRIFTIFGVEG